jgi:two-component system NarL family sensor kinase
VGAGEELERLRAENERLREELEECRKLVAHVKKSEDAARRRIAQLIHDDSLQSLLAANQELIEAAPGRAQVMRAHEVVEGTIARLREAMMALHPVTLEQGGLEQAIGAVARQAARQGGFEVALDLAPDALEEHGELTLSAARELLTNAARHSGARHVRVGLHRADGRIELEVADDGRGLQPGRREAALSEGHIGLASLTQLLHSAGGELAIESSGAGTTARVLIPLVGFASAAE